MSNQPLATACRGFLLLFGILFIQSNRVSCTDPAVAATLQQRIAHRRGYLVPLGSQITLSCPFETPFYKWTRPDYPSHFLDEAKNLTIIADSFDVSGRYQCSAVNGFGNSLAEMAVRVVDYSGPALRRECALTREGLVNQAGPCFLKSYTESELKITRYWGEDVTLDCGSVTADGRTYQLNYAWEFYKQGLGGPSAPSASVNRLARRSNPNGLPLMTPTGPGGGTDVTRFSDSQLTIRKVTLNNMGEYRCSVTNPSPDGSVSVIPKIERTFQLRVIPRSEGTIITGDHDVIVQVKSGQNLIQSCKVNAENHRHITIRWGKIFDSTKSELEEHATDAVEMIRLSNATFIVFPQIPTSKATDELTSASSSNRAFAVGDAGSSESQLFIRKVSGRDAGMYICSVVTESGWDDRKLVRVVVSDSQVEPKSSEENGYPRRLALYIAGPVVVFFVCIFIISYCMISRKSRRCSSHTNGSAHSRATLPAMRQMSSSNNSVGLYRGALNGNSLSGKTNAMGLIDHRTHSSPQGPPSGVGANQIVYSSSTGSHSLSGTSAGTPGSMLLANTMAQVLPPDGSGYPLLKPNGHHRPPGQPLQHPQQHNGGYDPYNGHPAGGGMVYMPSGYHDYMGQK